MQAEVCKDKLHFFLFAGHNNSFKIIALKIQEKKYIQ
jgi:hypothetical protein